MENKINSTFKNNKFLINLTTIIGILSIIFGIFIYVNSCSKTPNYQRIYQNNSYSFDNKNIYYKLGDEAFESRLEYNPKVSNYFDFKIDNKSEEFLTIKTAKLISENSNYKISKGVFVFKTYLLIHDYTLKNVDYSDFYLNIDFSSNLKVKYSNNEFVRVTSNEFNLTSEDVNFRIECKNINKYHNKFIRLVIDDFKFVLLGEKRR